jgi:hypothetical protein
LSLSAIPDASLSHNEEPYYEQFAGDIQVNSAILQPQGLLPLRRKGAQRTMELWAFFAPLCALAVSGILAIVKRQLPVKLRVM